jgi:hypothetical protein
LAIQAALRLMASSASFCRTTARDSTSMFDRTAARTNLFPCWIFHLRSLPGQQHERQQSPCSTVQCTVASFNQCEFHTQGLLGGGAHFANSLASHAISSRRKSQCTLLRFGSGAGGKGLARASRTARISSARCSTASSCSNSAAAFDASASAHRPQLYLDITIFYPAMISLLFACPKRQKTMLHQLS